MLEKYIHIERFGTDEVDGINIGDCHIFPKIDGTNASVWLEDGQMRFGSRNRELTPDDDNQGFATWASQQQPLLDLLNSLPEGSRVYGEWLVPHSLKTYREDAWRRFYIFDVLLSGGEFMHFNEYEPLCKSAGVDYIPCITKSRNPSYEIILKSAESNKFMLQDNCGIGEGVVVKQYGYKNRFGRTTWAKLITNQFKDKHIKEMGGVEINVTMIEETIANEFVSEHLVEKVVAKIRNDEGMFSAMHIPRLLETTFHDLVTEELWQALKTHKFPKVDFKTLKQFTIVRVKKLKPELFGA